jgi:16S rRNA (cytidine1402-2'-O)-methyltransferase
VGAGISDPGFLVVARARDEGKKIEVLPGASAFLAALSASGLPINHFTYLGFLPVKKGRHTLLQTFIAAEHTIVFYESPHRILKTLAELAVLLREQSQRRIVVARELTKVHEEVRTVRVADIDNVAKTLTVKGEFVVMIEPS